MTNISDSLAKLKSLAPNLNQAADSGDAIVANVEQFLNKECSLGVPAAVVVEQSNERTAKDAGDDRVRDYDVLALSYERLPSGKYGIALVESTRRYTLGVLNEWNEYEAIDDHETDRVVVPWGQASRINRLKALPKLPALIESLAGIVGKLAAAAHEANGAAAQLAKALADSK